MAQALNTAMKAVDVLKNFRQSTIDNPQDLAARKAEKIACCTVIADNICLPSVKTATHFSQVLSLAVKNLLYLCDDSDSDVRMLADECLNRIIKSMADSNIVKIQFQLYNMMSKNGSARCLRAALWRFGVLSHTIRPVKAKAYVSNLLPCIVAISQRSEESVIDTLAQSLPLILKSLGPFMTDKDVKMLLKAFYPNLISSQAVFRRNAASMILTTCLYCREPRIFLSYVLRNLIDVLVPVSTTENSALVIGVLGCLRIILPHISSNNEPELETDAHRLDCLVQIYELCLYYAKWNSDHNMINAALETLAQLLENPEDALIELLTSERGITCSKIIATDNNSRISLGHISASTITIDRNNSEPRLTVFEPDVAEVRPNVEQWIADSEKTFENVRISHADDPTMSGEVLELSEGRSDNRSSSNNRSIDNESNEDVNDAETSLNDETKLGPSISSTTIDKSPEKQYFHEEIQHSDDSSRITSSRADKDRLDIGSFTDPDVPLKYACRYLASTFLLAGKVGKLVADKYFRVSVKSLALNCIGNIVRIYPSIMSGCLAREPIDDGDRQMISDILLFAEHSDPQIRGNLAILVGNYLTAVYAKCKGSYALMEEDIVNRPDERVVPLDDLINLLAKGLDDDSTTACRQTLVAIDNCLNDILESEDNRLGVVVINKLLRLVGNPYFLVKVQLAEVLSELPYIAIKHVTGNFDFQDNVINVMIALLGDQDPRIRTAASDAIVRIVPFLYYQHPNETEVTRKASNYTELYLSTIMSEPLLTRNRHTDHKLLIDSLVEPFRSFHTELETRHDREKIENSLSIIISLLTEKLLVYSSKFLIYGCAEALSNISTIYATTIYPRAWDCYGPRLPIKRQSKTTGFGRGTEPNDFGLTKESLSPVGIELLALATSMMSSSPESLDMSTHRHLVLLAGNVTSGIALQALRPNVDPIDAKNFVDSTKIWHFFDDETLNDLVKSLFTHITRILNIYVHVIDGVQLVPPTSKSSLPSLPSTQSLSPRRKISVTDARPKERIDRTPNVMKIGKDNVGYFFPIPHYMKLYEILKSAHANYSTTLDDEASKMYLALLNSCLEVISQILEIASNHEAGKYADEILHYMQTTMTLSPTKTVQCVRQLLKCLFGTNLNARWNELEIYGDFEINAEDRRDDCRRGLYSQCFQKPVRHMAEMIKAMGNNSRGGNEPDVGWIGSWSRREDRKITTAFKSFARASDQKSSVTSFIKIFEPMVIKSLKRYTTTGCVPFQCQVLSLLTQLVRLHVNYCLLDTDKIFIGFVLDQFSFIDESQIQRTDELLPKIFDFLVNLSHNKYHTKNIIDVPKIIQLCDDLMASGQSPMTHCIPALVPTVEDIFIGRSSSTAKTPTDQRELETTREVLVTSLLRLIEYPRVVDLLARCIAESRYDSDGNGEEKWRRWSRLATDAVLSSLSRGKIRLETKNSDVALMKLFSAVSPTVFRPVDPLLKVLLVVPPGFDESTIMIERWLGMVNIVLLALISCAKEEAMLARLGDLSVNMTDLSMTLGLSDDSITVNDPLNATNSRTSQDQPENILAIFLFRVIAIAARRIRKLLGWVCHRKKISRSIDSTKKFDRVDDRMNVRLVDQLAFFLQLCINMFESGSHCRIVNATMQIMRKEKNFDVPIDELNSLMTDVMDSSPMLTCHWAYLMTLLDYSDVNFWSKIMGIRGIGWSTGRRDENREKILENPKKEKLTISQTSLNRRIVMESGTILFCDHVCENLNDAESLTWLLVNHIEETINLAGESPVRDLVTTAVHRNSAASGLLIQAIAARCHDISRPSFVKRLLQCVEGAHNCQSGAVIIALVPRFLDSHHLALSRMAAKIVSRRFEILLASTSEDAREQLPPDDFTRIMEIMRTTKLSRKYGTLVSLMNKLATARYDMSPFEPEHCRSFNPSTVKNINLDRQWFVGQVKIHCCNRRTTFDVVESAKLLGNLDTTDCETILRSKEFDLKILVECLRLGYRETKEKIRDNEFSDDEKIDEPCDLYRSSRDFLLEKIRAINELVPKNRQIYDPSSFANNGKTSKYVTRLSNLFDDEIYRENLFTVIPAVTIYVTTMKDLENYFKKIEIKNHDDDLAKFALLCLEMCHWIVDGEENYSRLLKPHELQLTLNCAEELLTDDGITVIFDDDDHRTWVCSMIKTLVRMVDHWSMKNGRFLTITENPGLSEAAKNEGTKFYADACVEISSLISWLENFQKISDTNEIPRFVLKKLKNLIIIAGRFSLVNDYVLTPPLAWKHGWQAEGTGSTGCNFPLLTTESNVLQEIDVLRQFIYRITLTGWTSRLQFEEMWMALLSVLSVDTDDNEKSIHDVTQGQTTCLAVQAITQLLSRTLLLPRPGNSTNGKVIHHSRDPQLSVHKKSSQRLIRVQDILSWKYEIMINSGRMRDNTSRLDNLYERGNIERDCYSRDHGYEQLSIPYLWSVCRLHEDKLSSSVIDLKKRREKALESTRLDLESCLRFLIELYTGWIAPRANTPPLLLNEIVKSLLSISDIFVERAQFQWMLDTCLEMTRIHPIENEILHHYLVVAVCKAAAVLAPLDVETLERLKQSIDLSLKSSFLPARITALHGMLYLLQSAVLADCEETMNVVHPLAIKYIQKRIEAQEDNEIIGESEDHQRIMWALVFFLLEHAEDGPTDTEAPAVLELVLTLVTVPNISTDLHRTLLQGLERLIGTRSVVGRVAEQIVKVAVDRLRQPSPLLALPALQLLLTCMYTESADRFNRPIAEEPLPDIEPEALVRSIERTSAIFDRIKRGYPTEVQVLCAVLSEVLGDFFSPSDILTKVIGEFLSPQQPHQRLLSAVVFKVCERVACNGAQLELLQDWVIFSLPNFIQSLPLAMSTWCLSCFFISASTNPWLRALFPHVQSRIGKYEYEDKKMLCIAASDFYHRLSSESQRRALVESFEAASKELGTPFTDILASF